MKQQIPTWILANLLVLVCLAGTRVVVSADLQQHARAGDAARQPTLVFLVRHAEKSGQGSDPELSLPGRQRAGLLAAMLKDAGVQHVHSTEYRRTLQTATPVARQHQLELQLYDPAQLHQLADRLLGEGGVHLVVGHSNTTPRLVQQLGGEPGPPINEPTEYDRLYLLTISADGTVHSVMLRYGQSLVAGD
jgi:broad specificity phosphatase PhoE